MSDSVWPHRQQPTRLPCPWDSPGKNTGVGCHFLLQCVKVKLLSHVRLCGTPWTAAYQAPPSMGFSRQEYGSGVPLPSLLENTTKKQTLGHWKLSLAYPRWLIGNTETWNLWFCRSEVNPGNFFFWRLPRWLYGQPGSSPTVLNLNLFSKPVS